MRVAILVLVGIALMAATPSSPTPLAVTFDTIVSDSGDISLPDDFRKNMAHLGSWFVPEGDASGFHDVYTQPETIGRFRETGVFPDGAVLVKELRGHDAAQLTTGRANWSNDTLKQWFVMVKDSTGRFSGNANWGDGWGWALFQPGKDGNVSLSYRADCLGCHVPAKQTDWVYVAGYPTLKRP